MCVSVCVGVEGVCLSVCECAVWALTSVGLLACAPVSVGM